MKQDEFGFFELDLECELSQHEVEFHRNRSLGNLDLETVAMCDAALEGDYAALEWAVRELNPWDEDMLSLEDLL